MEINLTYDQLNTDYSMLMSVLGASVSKHLIDEHFTCIWANEYYYKLIGYSKPEYERLFHNHCDEYYKNNPRGWNIIVERVTRALENGESGYTAYAPMKYPDGSDFWVKLQAIFTDEYIDGYRVSYTAMTDVTDLVQTQQERTIAYENIPGFIVKYRVKPDKISIVEVSDGFSDVFDVNAEGLKDFECFSAFSEESQEVMKKQFKELRKGVPFQSTIHVKDKNKKDRWFQVNFTCIETVADDPVYLAVYIDITDITELRELQHRLEERTDMLKHALKTAKQANRAKSEFLSRMSHDIRTPMNAITGMTEIAETHMDSPEKIKDCLQKIKLSSRHLLGLINDVLDMSKIESGNIAINKTANSLSEVLKDIIMIIQPNIQAKNQQFDIHLKKLKCEQFNCDALRLRQIFLNLLSNASKFTPQNGSVIFEVEELPSDNPEEAILSFLVADNGIGIKEEFLEKIFDAFSRERDSRTDKIEGSGLGMAITKKLVEILGGTITVKSKVGVGTAFYVTLPMEIEKITAEKLVFPHIRILLVDDDPIVCEYAEQVSKQLEVQLEYTDSGRKAVAKVVKANQDGNNYDIIFLDWKMPEQDGLETAKQIRKKIGKDLPILVLSAYDWNDIKKEAQEVGVNEFIEKPLFCSTLRHCIEKYTAGEMKTIDKTTKIDFAGKRFLLVDDNELNREIAIELFRNSNAVIEYACNGLEAVEQFEKVPEQYYDIILMDIQMPIMNGYEATKTIRSLPRGDAKTIPIFAMTADAFVEDIKAAEAAGMNGHLAKPLDFKVINRQIGKCLGI